MTGVLTFLGIAALIIVTPGQDTALIVRNTLGGGRRGGLYAAFGVSSGQAVWSLATAAGLAALLVASKPAFLVVKYVGVAYLLYLGAMAIRDAIRGVAHDAKAPQVRGQAAFRQGFISNLGNPKAAVFFTSLLPQFGTDFLRLWLLGLVMAVMTFFWLAGYVYAIERMGELLRRSRVRRALDAVTGTVLVALGLRLATTQGSH